MKGFLDRPIGNTQIIFNQIFSVSISSLYFVFFSPFFYSFFCSLCWLSALSLSLSLSLSLPPSLPPFIPFLLWLLVFFSQLLSLLASLSFMLLFPILHWVLISIQFILLSTSCSFELFFYTSFLTILGDVRFSIEIGGGKKGEIPDLFNVAILLKSSQIKAIYYIRLFYKFLRWGTHLYMSLFPSICPSVCCTPYLRNCTLSNHTFW